MTASIIPLPKLFVGMKVAQILILEIIPGSYPKGQKHISGGHKHKTVRCLCDCGIESIKYYASIRWHKTKSCGCLQLKVGQTHGLHKSTEYGSWDGMKRRCYNKASKDYERYGGRGITMCDRWKDSFENFIADIGFKPTIKHTLDRINNDGNYELSNCKWATPKQQAQNRRGGILTKEAVIKIRSLSETKTPIELALMFGVSRRTICSVNNRESWRHI